MPLTIEGGPFPLTPTLSPRERENRFLIWSAKRFWFVRRRAAQFPLPKGEGQGEGEQDVSQPDAPNAPPKFKSSKREISFRGILSPRERASVRGNKLLANQTRVADAQIGTIRRMDAINPTSINNH